jgi:type IX secretion system PorP/SprF family membrane protein
LSFGLSGSADQSVLDGSAWDPISPGDPLLEDGKESFFNFNANFGVYYYSATYYTGIAANHLIPLEDKVNPGETVKQDYIVHGGYLFRSMEDIKIEPSVHIRYLDYESLEYDIRAKVYLQHIHWIALTYRSYKALALTAGLKIRRFYLAYNFEANLSPIISYSAGTHGIHIGMNLGMRRLEEF